MASFRDLADRIQALGAQALYTATPPKLLAQVQGMVDRGSWPVVVNCKGAKLDAVLLVLPLSEYERLAQLDAGGVQHSATNDDHAHVVNGG